MTQIFTSAARQIKLGGLTLFAPENAPSVREISHSLAQINRFTGHCKRPYSVAEHSLLAADTARVVLGVSPIVELAVLFHDAHECLCGDTSTPVKQMLGYVWRSFEYSLQRMVLSHYRLDQVFDANEAVIKRCDLIALATERRDLLPFDAALHDPWPSIDGADGPTSITPRGTNLMGHYRVNTRWSEWAQAFERRSLNLIAMVDRINLKATAQILAN
jgi:hypothetical protein